MSYKVLGNKVFLIYLMYDLLYALDGCAFSPKCLYSKVFNNVAFVGFTNLGYDSSVGAGIPGL